MGAGCRRSPIILVISSSVVKALNGFDTSVNGTGDGGAFGISTVTTSTLTGDAILRCHSSFPRGGQAVLCVSARRKRPRYRGMLRHVLYLTKLPGGTSSSGLVVLNLQGCSPRVELTVIRRTVNAVPGLKLIVVSNVESFVCSVGSPGRTAGVVSGFVR